MTATTKTRFARYLYWPALVAVACIWAAATWDKGGTHPWLVFPFVLLAGIGWQRLWRML